MKCKQTFLSIPIQLIDVPASAVRKSYDRYELDMLKKSISVSGLLEPITVYRRNIGRYTLVSGRRRLEACTELGYSNIDCFVVADSPAGLMLRALIDSVQQRQLNMFELSEAIADFKDKTNLNNSDLARVLGTSELEVSEQLKLLDLDKRHRDILLSAGVSRAQVLKIISLPRLQQAEAVKHIVSSAKNNKSAVIKPFKLETAKVGDIRLFLNSLNHIVDSIKRAGYISTATSRETKNYYEYTVKISKSPQMTLPDIQG